MPFLYLCWIKRCYVYVYQSMDMLSSRRYDSYTIALSASYIPSTSFQWHTDGQWATFIFPIHGHAELSTISFLCNCVLCFLLVTALLHSFMYHINLSYNTSMSRSKLLTCRFVVWGKYILLTNIRQIIYLLRPSFVPCLNNIYEHCLQVTKTTDSRTRSLLADVCSGW